jgi:hypothetical protein|tara:strand:- start:235 stop:393 length:159 start_codon:yes stop_codon:yes gene_type:complete
MINFKNGWKSKAKQDDKFVIEIRLGKISVFEMYFDISDKKFTFGVFNFFIHN